MRSTNWPSDSVPVSADDAVEVARRASERATRRNRLRVPRRTKSVSVSDPFAQSQSSSERLEQHSRSLPSPQSSLTPLSSSILADMRSSSKDSKDQECASVGTTLTTSNVGYLSRPMVLPPPPDHDASSPADDAWSWKSAGTMMDTTPIHTEVSEASVSWRPVTSNVLPPLPPMSCELRFWLEAMETAQKADVLQDPARFLSPHGRATPNRLHKDSQNEVDLEVNALRQQVQHVAEERDVARSELAELKAEHARLQESEEKLRRGQRELEAQRRAEQADWQRRVDELRVGPPAQEDEAAKVEEKENEEEAVQPTLRVDLRSARPQWNKLSKVVRAQAAWKSAKALSVLHAETE